MYQEDKNVFSDGSTGDANTIPSSVTSLSPELRPSKPVSASFVVSELEDLFSENSWAKIWRVAVSYIEQCPDLTTYPEYVPPRGEAAGKFLSKPSTFWTCGFFPASLYCLLERSTRFPQTSPKPLSMSQEDFHTQLLSLCRQWSTPLRANESRTNSHDLGFIMRALRMDWELTGNTESLNSYIAAAESLATRYDDNMRAIRSWDKAVSHSYDITDRAKNFLIIVDSMCNMDLLYYAARHTSNSKLSSIATTHAHTVLRTLVRPDHSTWHVANLDPLNNGAVQFRMTHQGYSDDSTWSRGQAWTILGFAQTYMWTQDLTFLAAAQNLADCFLARLAESPAPTHRNVPMWDFDAPPQEDVDTEGQPLRDASAGAIAANGLLLIHQALQAISPGHSSPYLQAALRIMSDTAGYCVDRDDVASLSVDEAGKVQVAPGTWDAILRHATANNNQNTLTRYFDVGLVYADYYFLEFGNKLLRMGLA